MAVRGALATPGAGSPSGGEATSAVTLRLLGSWSVSGLPDGGPEITDAGRRLLALLALRGRMTRAHVGGTLWPEVDDASAAARLRTLLWRLQGARTLLDPGDGALGLASRVVVDVDELRALAAALYDGVGDGVRPEDIAGDLLPGWYDDWLVADRERVRQLRLHALEALAGLRLREGRFAAAVDAGLVAVAAEPLRESAHRLVIDAHLAEGNLTEALRQYETLRALFATELGVEPSLDIRSRLPAHTS